MVEFACFVVAKMKRRLTSYSSIVPQFKYGTWQEIGLVSKTLILWLSSEGVQKWCSHLVLTYGGRRKPVGSLFMLVSWELWNEQNTRILKSKSTIERPMMLPRGR
jgi:hypothetical protein